MDNVVSKNQPEAHIVGLVTCGDGHWSVWDAKCDSIKVSRECSIVPFCGYTDYDCGRTCQKDASIEMIGVHGVQCGVSCDRLLVRAIMALAKEGRQR